MPFVKGRAKTGGRKKGVKNKFSKCLWTEFSRFDFNPIQAFIESLAQQPAYMQADTLAKVFKYMFPDQSTLKSHAQSDEDGVIDVGDNAKELVISIRDQQEWKK